MDLLFNLTLRVLENRNAAKENLTQFEGDITEYQNYIRSLKKNLVETLSLTSKYEEIVEINSYIKKEYEGSLKNAKALFGLIYTSVQQVEENLQKLRDGENTLQKLYEENKVAFNEIEKNISNNIRFLTILQKDVEDKGLQKFNSTKSEISKTDEEIKSNEEVWQNMIEEFEEKQKAFQALVLEVEVLQEKLETKTQEYESSFKGRSCQIDEEVQKFKNEEMELQQKISKAQEETRLISDNLKTALEQEAKISSQILENKETINTLDKKYAEIKLNIEEEETRVQQKLEEINKAIQENETQIEEYEKFEENLNVLEAVAKRKATAQKETEANENSCRKLQETVEQHQTKLKEIEMEEIKLEENRLAKNEELKKISSECEEVAKEIERLKLAKKTPPPTPIKRIAPPPNLKRPTPPPTPKRPFPPETPKRANPPTPRKKRPFFQDFESDSSLDGDRMSYAEFMARKRSLKQSKIAKK